MSRAILILVGVLCSAQGVARVGVRHASLSLASRLRVAFGTVGFVSALPASLSFQASNPDAGAVSGSSPSSLSFSVLSGSHANNWTLSVQADSSSFDGCPTIPVAAVQVSCGTTSVGTGGTGTCSGSFPLSTSLQQVAGGAQADGTNTYTVSINFTLAESWRYVANPSCSTTLTYSVYAQ